MPRHTEKISFQIFAGKVTSKGKIARENRIRRQNGRSQDKKTEILDMLLQ
jgi:hypothetical protein